MQHQCRHWTKGNRCVRHLCTPLSIIKDAMAFFGPTRPTGCKLGLIGCLHPRRARLRSCNPPLHLGKHPNPPFPRSQALELQARAMAARKTGSARVGRRRGRPREKARITALLVISSPPPLLSSFFHLALAIFFSSPPFVTWSLVIEIHGTVTSEYCLPLPPAHLTSVFICSDSVPNIRVLLLSLSLQRRWPRIRLRSGFFLSSPSGELDFCSDLCFTSLFPSQNGVLLNVVSFSGPDSCWSP
jgi:hypothetical protein